MQTFCNFLGVICLLRDFSGTPAKDLSGTDSATTVSLDERRLGIERKKATALCVGDIGPGAVDLLVDVDTLIVKEEDEADVNEDCEVGRTEGIKTRI